MTHAPMPRSRRGTLRLAAALVAMPILTAAAAAASPADSSFFGLVEGAAAVERAGVTEAAAEDQQLLAGDRLTTARGARLEIQLGDETAIFVAGDGEVVFATLAGERAEDDLANLLRLERGELLLASEGGVETRVDTENASIYVGGAGSYRIERTDDATLVIARRGEAELRTRRGVVAVAEGEQGWIEGDGSPVVARAADADALERWAAALDERRERLAYEDEGVADFAYDDFGFGFWDFGDVGFGCARGCGSGSAARTRPSHPPSGPGSADGPGRWAVPIGDDAEDDADAGIEIAIAKPWPLDDANDAEAVPVAKPPLDETVEEASVEGAFVDSAAAKDAPKPDDAKPASADFAPASTANDSTATIHSPTTDHSSASYDSAPAANTSWSNSFSDSSSSDGGSSTSAPADAPSHDAGAGTEPNR